MSINHKVNGVMIQYFQWYLPNDGNHWKKVKQEAKNIAQAGFSSIWLPPAFKGQGGINDVGYGVYDLYDLGEFDQKGTVRTKYGTKDEYLAVIEELHKYHLEVYADMVLNHRMGADGTELVMAVENDSNDRNKVVSDLEQIEAWTRFDCRGRNGKYSTFVWNRDCFDGVDYDERSKRHAIYEFNGDSWDELVDNENGNYDYLMGADIDFDNQAVVDELIRFGKWYLDFTHVDGFRLDAIKHIDFTFFTKWLQELRTYSNKQLFAVGEYWHGDVNKLLHYLDVSQHCMTLFDVTLHFKFYQISHSNGTFDMGSIFEGTLVKLAPKYAVTFVDNHDSQPGQALQSSVANWFKPLAYALILLKNQGYPCVFYGDYYGMEEYGVDCFKVTIDKMLKVRNECLYGDEHDYFDHHNVIGWTYEGDLEHINSSMAVIMSDGPSGEKEMYIGKCHHGETFVDYLNNINQEVIIDENGNGKFICDGGSVSLWVKKSFVEKNK